MLQAMVAHRQVSETVPSRGSWIPRKGRMPSVNDAITSGTAIATSTQRPWRRSPGDAVRAT